MSISIYIQNTLPFYQLVHFTTHHSTSHHVEGPRPGQAEPGRAAFSKFVMANRNRPGPSFFFFAYLQLNEVHDTLQMQIFSHSVFAFPSFPTFPTFTSLSNTHNTQIQMQNTKDKIQRTKHKLQMQNHLSFVIVSAGSALKAKKRLKFNAHHYHLFDAQLNSKGNLFLASL